MIPGTWNTDRDGTRSRVYGKWHNWLDQSGWRAIDGGFHEDSGRYVANQIPGLYSVPMLATGAVEFEVNQRWDIFTQSPITDAPWSLEITPENVSPVAAQRDDDRPDQVLYPNAFADGIDLRYTVWIGRGPRVTREIVIRREPPGDHDLRGSWRLRSSNVRTYVRTPNGEISRPWSGKLADKAVAHGSGIILRAGTSSLNESLVRGSGIRSPKAWYYKPDGTLISTPIAVEFTIVSPDTVRAIKIIPRAFVREAFAAGAAAVMSDDTSTFYPDPNAETTSVDGYVTRNVPGTWSEQRNGAGTAATDNDSIGYTGIESLNAPLYVNFYRSMFLFDTSSLTGDVSSAGFNVKHHSTSSDSTLWTVAMSLVGSTPASNTALVAADFQQTGTTRLSDTDIDKANWTGTLNWGLNAAGIASVNTSGISKFALRLGIDTSNTAPTSQPYKIARMQMYLADTAGTASDPYLEVVMAAGGGGSTASLIGSLC